MTKNCIRYTRLPLPIPYRRTTNEIGNSNGLNKNQNQNPGASTQSASSINSTQSSLRGNNVNGRYNTPSESSSPASSGNSNRNSNSSSNSNSNGNSNRNSNSNLNSNSNSSSNSSSRRNMNSNGNVVRNLQGMCAWNDREARMRDHRSREEEMSDLITRSAQRAATAVRNSERAVNSGENEEQEQGTSRRSRENSSTSTPQRQRGTMTMATTTMMMSTTLSGSTSSMVSMCTTGAGDLSLNEEDWDLGSGNTGSVNACGEHGNIEAASTSSTSKDTTTTTTPRDLLIHKSPFFLTSQEKVSRENNRFLMRCDQSEEEEEEEEEPSFASKLNKGLARMEYSTSLPSTRAPSTGRSVISKGRVSNYNASGAHTPLTLLQGSRNVCEPIGSGSGIIGSEQLQIQETCPVLGELPNIADIPLSVNPIANAMVVKATVDAVDGNTVNAVRRDDAAALAAACVRPLTCVSSSSSSDASSSEEEEEEEEEEEAEDELENTQRVEDAVLSEDEMSSSSCSTEAEREQYSWTDHHKQDMNTQTMINRDSAETVIAREELEKDASSKDGKHPSEWSKSEETTKDTSSPSPEVDEVMRLQKELDASLEGAWNEMYGLEMAFVRRHVREIEVLLRKEHSVSGVVDPVSSRVGENEAEE